MISPAVAAAASETHAALVLSTQDFAGALVFEGSVCTMAQLRAGGAPNPWETAWVVWNYTDNDHFYYLALKTNGWELGKRDPAYEGGQRFLATGDAVTFEVGAWTRFSIEQDGGTIRVRADGVELTRFEDLERPYMDGRVGIYSEDATVLFDDASGAVSDDFEALATGGLSEGSDIGGKWEVAFLGYGTGGVIAVEPEPTAPVREPPLPDFDLAALAVSRVGEGGWMFA